MFKIALALGIAFEWLYGASVNTVHSFGYAALRALCATLLCWMALEGIRVLVAAAMSLDPRPPGQRHRG
jgi:hypothetical protein